MAHEKSSTEQRAAPEQLREIAVAACAWLIRPRVRLTVIGVILLLAGGVLVTGSMWTLPLIIAGALMVAIAWVGHRLDGRLALEWGETGTQLEFRAQIKAPVPVHAYPELPVAPPGATPEPEDADVVEGEAHTVEIEVAELRALIAAAATAEAGGGPPGESGAHGARGLRVANGGARAAEAAP